MINDSLSIMIADRISRAIVALRAASHPVEPLPDGSGLYRVDGRDPVTGHQVLVLALRLGLLDGRESRHSIARFSIFPALTGEDFQML
jgi:hypothetical protein